MGVRVGVMAGVTPAWRDMSGQQGERHSSGVAVMVTARNQDRLTTSGKLRHTLREKSSATIRSQSVTLRGCREAPTGSRVEGADLLLVSMGCLSQNYN